MQFGLFLIELHATERVRSLKGVGEGVALLSKKIHVQWCKLMQYNFKKQTSEPCSESFRAQIVPGSRKSKVSVVSLM